MVRDDTIGNNNDYEAFPETIDHETTAKRVGEAV
jgi:hypothetical protein